MLFALCFLSNGQQSRVTVKTTSKTIKGIGKATDKAVANMALDATYIMVRNYGENGHPIVAVRDKDGWREPDPQRDGSVRERLAAGWQP